ncbi:MAG: tetratricopeptide repeat protein [Terriglobales bacterium]|jgi:DNA-binding winged helix-turn-helix (wHTH) protein/tetratricopeptide (TPR) repeat protein
MTTGTIFQFGEGFQVDTLARTLRREDEVVTLNRRAFDVLLYLVQNPGRVLSRDELLKSVWPDTFVDESSLVQSIYVLRRALSEQPGDNNYIVTLPGRGYQFASPVKVVSEGLSIIPATAGDAMGPSNGIVFQQDTIQTSTITHEKKEEQSFPMSPSQPLVRWIAVFAVAAAAVAGTYAWREIHRAPPPMHSTLVSRLPRRSIAVLGFRNLSGRPEEAWVSTALAEMLSTELVAGEKLRLVSGEDIARTKLDLPLADSDSLSRETLSRLHKNLDSDLIVLGSYTTVGEKPDTRIRIDLRLQDTAAGETVADVAVVGNEADLFDVVSQAGSRLREKLGVEAVSPVEAVSVRASLPANREATRLYSEGLARLRVFDALAARDLLQRAIAADPKFALAHSALAEAWARMGYDKKAQQEARQAYDMSANLSREEKLLVEGRYREIGHEYDKAIEIDRTLYVLFPDNLDYGLKLAAVQTLGSKAHDALATVESLRKLSPPASDDPRIDLQEATAWDVLSEYKQLDQPLSRAVEKARVEGSRLILAHARRGQCMAFEHIDKIENAIAACREAGDIFAAAGDREDEASSLRTWADAISQTDASESIRLYKQAQEVFRGNGSERGVAGILNNLALVYEAQGDPATAEKMQRQALAGFRVLDDKSSQAKALGNIANERLEQGDLGGALQLYEESRQLDREDTGRVANVSYNIANVHELQGDLARAKQGFEQSLAIWQKNGDQHSSAYALWSLGNVLLLTADFAGARKMYEQALAMRTTEGDALTVAETRLSIADLSLEEAHSPIEQEEAIRQVIEVVQKLKDLDDETNAWCSLARALLAEGKGAAATQAAQHAQSLSSKEQTPEVRWNTAIAAARIETAEKDAVRSAAGIAARKELTAVIAKSRGLGYRLVELDARLALAEIEMKSRQTAEGRAHLAAIEADAKAIGYNLVARKAATPRP